MMNPSLVCEINREALRDNTAFVRRIVGQRRIIACVKGNAYGHGMLTAAREVLAAGADALAVARVGEVQQLRDAGFETPILLIAAESLEACDDLVRLDAEIFVESRERLEAITSAAKRLGRRAKVHLAINSGMNRFDADERDARDIAEIITNTPEIEWAGVMTHFAVADADVDATREHWRKFDSLTADWAKAGIPRHAANSAGILTLSETHADAVRPGLMLYGMQPCTEHFSELRPVMTWKTSICAIHSVPKGVSVGYGGTFTAVRDTLVATLPAGYGDGMHRSAGNRAFVLVRGKRCAIIGRISMDQATIDVTDVPGVKNGDEIILIGRQGDDEITASEWAQWCQTINYEITTSITARVPRIET